MQTPQSMDATDSGQERVPAPNPSLALSPTSRGRQRKKNSKFLDYEVSEVYDGQTPQTPVTKRSRRAPASPKVRANAAPDDKDEDDEGGEPEEAPKRGRKRRGRKPWGKKAVGKSSEAGEQDGAADNETPRPKRKYTKRKKAEELQREEEKNDDGTEEVQEDWETTGARPKRGAARAALKYLHSLAKDELRQPDEQKNEANGDCEAPVQKEPAWKTPRRRRGYKRKRAGGSDGEEDEEFVPNAEDDAEEEEEGCLEEEDEEGVPDKKPLPKYSKNWTGGFRSDGPPTATLQAIKVTAQANRDYRQKFHSSWVFPDWIPSSSDWQLLPHSEAERYLPEEQRSMAFSVSREGLKKEAPLRLDRFCSVPWHPDRWDSLFFCGGPVWSLEWCPAPDAALEASQFVALSCHRDMDETHRANQLYDGAGLVQIWELGALQTDKRPDSQPALVYSVAQDRGFVWGLKWCPSGAWEPPDSDRQAPLLPRLGLLAVASSQGVVTVYSLPHPQALTRACSLSDSASASSSAAAPALPPVFKAKAVVTLRLGSFKAPRLSDSGQVLALDWLPHKPHNVIAVGFYDGHVGLWDVSTRSSLLRVREGDGSMTVLPYECFSAHDLPVTHVSFCPASRQLLVTAGEDRFVKTWDLTRVYEPVTQQKRQLVREVCWPLFAPGFFVAEESGYSSHVVHGVHFYTHYMNALYPIPRSATLWSLAFSDWLNMVVTCDSLGELILCTMPLLTDYTLNRVKRTIESRFPLQFSAMVPLKTAEEEAPPKETVEEEETRPTETAEEEEKQEEEGAKENPDQACPEVESYRETAESFHLQMTDFNLKTFMNFHKRPMWKRMKAVEQKTPLRLDHFPMTALHKVRFSPNFSSRTWVISAGQSGIVRLHCIRSVNYKTKPTSKDDPEESQPSPAPETSPSPGHADPAQPL